MVGFGKLVKKLIVEFSKLVKILVVEENEATIRYAYIQYKASTVLYFK